MKYFKPFQQKNGKGRIISIGITVCGLILFASIILVFVLPGNRMCLASLFLSGGMLNVLNGQRMAGEKAKHSTGVSMMFFGILIIALGVYLLAMLR